MNTTTENRTVSFAAFTEKVAAQVQERYAGYEVRTVSVDKNNGLVMTGLVILPPDRKAVTSPNVYLDGFYKDYLAGTPIGEITDRVTEGYEANRLTDESCIHGLERFEAVKDRICCRLVNDARNEAYLERIPHRPFLDLAIVYCIPLEMEDDTTGTVTVTNGLAGLWQVDEETLYRHAEANTHRLFPAGILPMDELIRALCPDYDMEELGSGLFILQNGVGNGGAGAMLCAPVLEEFAKQHGSFYILPSSIFEVILLPGGPDPADAEDVCCMVRAVNGTQLSPEEVLSDNAYFYHADTGEIEILS